MIDIQKGGEEKVTIRERKSSMGAYMHNHEEKKPVHKPLTPTRVGSSKNKKKSWKFEKWESADFFILLKYSQDISL